MAIDLNAFNAMYKDRMATLAVKYGVSKHQAALVEKINMLCLRIGFLSKKSPEEAKAFRNELAQAINQIASDETERDKLSKYTNKIIDLALKQLQ